ncbi:hypothetical protein Ddye_020011 [Dipteronia dyeriana]|uniref:Uncharacterized protein n=1 Tax=Dipteronia dyeriana TaxID=168575 RepID=A0AAD9TZ00_9ROSI|nr:hypothetical protein Ddye_020011 [Dipteronia dyeriana]
MFWAFHDDASSDEVVRGDRLLMRDLYHDDLADGMRFMLGSHSVRFSKVEFCLITGLQFGVVTYMTMYDSVENGIQQRYFPDICFRGYSRDWYPIRDPDGYQPVSRILKWELNKQPRGDKLTKIFTARIFARTELVPTAAERGQRYFAGIERGGSLYKDIDIVDVTIPYSDSVGHTSVRPSDTEGSEPEFGEF